MRYCRAHYLRSDRSTHGDSVEHHLAVLSCSSSYRPFPFLSFYKGVHACTHVYAHRLQRINWKCAAQSIVELNTGKDSSDRSTNAEEGDEQQRAASQCDECDWPADEPGRVKESATAGTRLTSMAPAFTSDQPKLGLSKHPCHACCSSSVAREVCSRINTKLTG